MNTLAFSLPSFAKINLTLRILGRRPDGYHEVRTQLQTISLHDDLGFATRSDGVFSLSCDDSELPTDEGNLIVRAARVLQNRFQVKSGASITLTKRIPIKAGLGGGSSNAAIALIGLARLWNLKLSPADLNDLGASLGADVPFFFLGGRALGMGRGSELRPLPEIQKTCLLIVSPNATVSTAEAYAALSAPALTYPQTESILAVSQSKVISYDSDQWDLNDDLANDFEPVIFDREPEIARAKKALLNAGARGALLAGSGSSVFGIFDDVAAQQRAAGLIQAEVGWRLSPCVTVSRAEYALALKSSGGRGSF